MLKNYVLDTNVLINDTRSLFAFGENNVVIPIFVIEELDSFKRENTERGRNAREVARVLDELRSRGSIADGVSLSNGGTLRVDVGSTIRGCASNDEAILKTAFRVMSMSPSVPTVFVTMDTNLRIRADVLGLRAETYANQSVERRALNSEVVELDVGTDDIESFFHSGAFDTTAQLAANACVMLRNSVNLNQTAIGRYDPVRRAVVGLKTPREGILGVRPRNREQSYALDILLDETIQLVTIVGKAGTGKTLLALAAGLKQTVESDAYARVLVSRPVIPMGRDIGYIPGSIDEKMAPWMQPIYDNLEYLSGKNRKLFDEVMSGGKLQVEPLTYIRGRSIPQQFMIVDECFPYETPVVTELGKRQIGSLFTKWMRGDEVPRVKSFDETTKTFVWNRITNMWHRGVRKIVQVHASNRTIRCTPNHPFLTTDGWKPAETLKEGDFLVASNPEENQVLQVLTPDLEQIMLGSLLGDGSFSTIGHNRVRLAVNHGRHQKEYAAWKASMFDANLKEVLGGGYNPHEPTYGFVTKLYAYAEPMPCPKQSCPTHVLEKLNAKGLAIWFMDDGSAYTEHNGATFNTQRFDLDSQHALVGMLQSKFGVSATIHKYESGHVLRLNKEAYLTLSKVIGPWVHQNLAYKLPEGYEVGAGRWDATKPEYGLVVVSSVEDAGVSEHVFDMEVERDHNFLIPSHSRTGEGAIVVHNCQNLSHHEVKTIITRSGEGTKIVLVGDPDQIDNPYVDSGSNGLSVAVDKFRGERIAAHVTLTAGVRSELAELAANVM